MARTELNTGQILDGTIVDADVDASAAIAGTKISPDFGAQVVTTTSSFIQKESDGGNDATRLESNTTRGVISLLSGGVVKTQLTGGIEDNYFNGGGKFGIGTTLPQEKLQVAVSSDNAEVTGLNIVNTDVPIDTEVGQAISIDFQLGSYSGAGNIAAKIVAGKDDDFSAVVGDIDGNLQFYTTNTASVIERMRIDSNGDVGIGTNSPSQRLEVASSVSDDARLLINDTSAANRTITMGWWSSANRIETGIAGPFYVGTAGADDFRLRVNGSDALTIDGATSRVGIGTTDPTNQLDVESGATGVASFVGTAGDAEVYIIDNAGGVDQKNWGLYTDGESFRLRELNDAFSASTSPLHILRSGGKVGLGVTPQAKLHSQTAGGTSALANAREKAGLWVDESGGTWGVAVGQLVTSLDSYIQAMHTGQASVAKLALNPYGGLVGVGTDSPDVELTVSGSNPAIDLQNSGTSYFRAELDGSNISYLSTIGTNNLVLRTDQTAAITIDGTAQGVTFASTVKISGGSPGANKVLTSDADGDATWESPNGGGWSDDGGTVRLTTAGDDVAIGTATANSKLTVSDDLGLTSGEHLLADLNRAGSGGILMGYRANGAAVDGGYVRSPASMDLSIGTGNSTQLIFLDDSTSRVGIGSTAPVATLHVGPGADTPTVTNPQIHASNTGTVNISARDSTNDVEIGMRADSSGVGIIGTHTSHTLDLRTGDTNRLRIDTDGHVGIGTTTPNYSGQVSGTVLTVADTTALEPGFLELAGNGNDADNVTVGVIYGIDTSNPTNNVGSFILTRTDGTGDDPGYDMEFNTKGSGAAISGTPAMTLTSSRNLHIGGQSTSHKLQVTGSSVLFDYAGTHSVRFGDSGSTFFGFESAGTSTTFQNFTNTIDYIQFSLGDIVFNEDGNDLDLRVESSTISNAFFVDGGTGGVGINRSANIDFPLVVQTNSLANSIKLIGRDNGSLDESTITFYDADGTTSASIFIQRTGDVLGINNNNAGGAVVVNDDNSGADFRVEGSTDTNLLVADGSNNTIGIGVVTGTHAGKLHIEANGETVIHTQTGTGDIIFDSRNQDNVGRSVVVFGNTADQGYLDVYQSDGVLATHISSNAITYFNGASAAVGIGTTSPASGVSLHNAGVTYSLEHIVGTESSVHADVKTAFGTTPAIVITDNQSAADGIVNIGNTNNTIGGHFYGANTRSTNNSADVIVAADDNLATFFGYGADGAKYLPGGGMMVSVDGTPALNDMGSRLTFLVNAGGTGTTEAMRITSSGQVGISQTATNAQLHIGGTASLGFTNASGIDHTIVASQSGGAMTFGVDSNSEGGDAYIGFLSQGTEYFRIDHGGNVGVGTTSPNKELHTIGTIMASQVDSTSLDADVTVRTGGAPQGVFVGDPSSNHTIALVGNGANASSTKISAFKTRSASPATDATTIVADNDAIFGIHAYGADGTDEFREAGFIQIEVDGTPVNDAVPGAITFGTTPNLGSASLERMRIAADGSVGIGTTTPDTLFDIEGSTGAPVEARIRNTGTANGDVAKLRTIVPASVNQADPEIVWTVDAAQSWAMGIDNSDSDKLKIGYSETLGTNTVMVFNTSGQVGIGTSSPSEALEVNGGIKASTVRFSQTWNLIQEDGTDLSINGDNNIIFKTANTVTALTIDASQNSTFAGTVAAYTGGDSAVYVGASSGASDYGAFGWNDTNSEVTIGPQPDQDAFRMNTTGQIGLLGAPNSTFTLAITGKASTSQGLWVGAASDPGNDLIVSNRLRVGNSGPSGIVHIGAASSDTIFIDNTATGAAGNTMVLDFRAKDSGGTMRDSASIRFETDAPTASLAPGNILFQTASSGAAMREVARFDAAGTLLLKGNGVTAGNQIALPTSDASDTGILQVSGGGAAGVTRGAYINLNGNEHASTAGKVQIFAGDVADGDIEFYTDSSSKRLTVEESTGKVVVEQAVQIKNAGGTTPVDGYVWTATDANGNGDWEVAASGGDLVQHKYTEVLGVVEQLAATSIPHDDTIPQSSEGFEAMTVSITPTSSSNKIIVEASVNMAVSSFSGHKIVALFLDSESSARAVSAIHGGIGSFSNLSLRYEMTSGTTSAMTFKIRIGSSAGTETVWLNATTASSDFGGKMISTLTADEIAV